MVLTGRGLVAAAVVLGALGAGGCVTVEPDLAPAPAPSAGPEQNQSAFESCPGFEGEAAMVAKSTLPPAFEVPEGLDAEGLCAGACKAMQTCDGELDTEQCTAQCALEVTGEGHLDPDIAIDMFTTLAAVEDDADCRYTRGRHYWTKWGFEWDASLFDTGMRSQTELVECYVAQRRCQCDATERAARIACFFGYYVFNEPIRHELRRCYAQDACVDIHACIQTAAPWGQPWFGGLEEDPWY